MEGKLILITGGSRSGKSEFAEELVHDLGEKCAYIATAEILDDEMKRRVKIHQERRKSNFWTNYESPFDAHDTIKNIKNVDSILFDCVTIYITNIIYKDSNDLDINKIYDVVMEKIKKLVDAAKQTKKHVVFVTNEVGSGIVPFDRELRGFRDLAGLVNQTIAKEMDEVYLVVSGIPVELKEISCKRGKKNV